MGDEVANFSPGAVADAMVFVRGDEALYTGGKKFLGALTGAFVPSREAVLRVAIVDAQSGAVLYVDSASPSVIEKDLEKSFKKFGYQRPKK
jgi:hypothetical protein